jgi:FAD/FMN-containing dehydrogenase
MPDKTSRTLTRRATLAAGALTGLAATLGRLGATPIAQPAPKDALQIFRRGDANYEAVRRSMIWNLYKPARYPDMIVRARSEQDVIAAVKMARREGLKLTVRNTGHTRSASFMRDGGMLLDVSALADVKIDPGARISVVGPGVRAGVLLNELGKHGLFFPTTHDPVVGMAGYIMSGGFGWCANRYGFAASNLLAIDVVTADGELIHSDDTENPDFVWCARGAGPGMFGVVTKFYLKVHDAPRAMRMSTYAYPKEAWPEVARWLMEISPTMSRDLEVYLFTNYKVGGPGTQTEPATMLAITAMSDSDEAATRALQPFENCPIIHKASVRKFAEAREVSSLFRFYGDMMPASYRFFLENAWIDRAADEVIPALAPSLDAPPNDISYSLWLPFPHVAPIPNAAMSYAADWCIYMIGLGRHESEDPQVRGWVLDGARRLDSVSNGGIMLNEEDLVARPVRNILAPEKWTKYQQLRAKHDPKGVFGGFRVA